MATRINCPTCPYCLRPSFFYVESDALAQKIREWKNNPVDHIQSALSELTPDQREQIITGFHNQCWEELFTEEEK